MSLWLSRQVEGQLPAMVRCVDGLFKFHSDGAIVTREEAVRRARLSSHLEAHQREWTLRILPQEPVEVQPPTDTWDAFLTDRGA